MASPLNLTTDVWLPGGTALSGGTLVPSGSDVVMDFILKVPTLAIGTFMLHITGMFSTHHTQAYSVLSADADGYGDSDYYELYPYAGSSSETGTTQTQDILIGPGINQYDDAVTAGETFVYVFVDSGPFGSPPPVITAMTWEVVTAETVTVTVVPTVELVNGVNGPSAGDPPALVGSDPWDANLGTYSFTATYWDETAPSMGLAYYTFTVGHIPEDILEIVEAQGLTSLTLNLTAKYDDDASAVDTTPGFSILLGDYLTGDPWVGLARQDAEESDRDQFHVDDNDTHTYSSSTWMIPNEFDLATLDQIRAAFLEGTIVVQTGQIASRGDFTTRAWVYALSFDLTYVTYTTGPPPVPSGEGDLVSRRHFARSRRS